MIQTNYSVDVMPYEQKWVDGLNSGDVSAADDVFTADAIIHINGNPQKDLTVTDFKQMVQALLTAFPDLKFTIEDQFAFENKVSTRWTATGTHTASLGYLNATGKRVNVDGIIIDYLENDKVSERWELWDQMAMLQQLGVM
jgi:steroid delta-isomerase-like uncharacterized protein